MTEAPTKAEIRAALHARLDEIHDSLLAGAAELERASAAELERGRRDDARERPMRKHLVWILLVLAVLGVVYQAVLAPPPDPGGIHIRSELDRFQ